MSKTPTQLTSRNFLALDVGGVRIGLAVAGGVARFPRPLLVISNDQNVWDLLQHICDQEQIGSLIVGLPRNMNGEDTQQTRICREFAKQLETKLGLPVFLQDEALTSVKAESELVSRGKKFDKGDIDSQAAVYILGDFLSDHPEGRSE